jgi:hypothetical protein
VMPGASAAFSISGGRSCAPADTLHEVAVVGQSRARRTFSYSVGAVLRTCVRWTSTYGPTPTERAQNRHRAVAHASARTRPAAMRSAAVSPWTLNALATPQKTAPLTARWARYGAPPEPAARRVREAWRWSLPVASSMAALGPAASHSGTSMSGADSRTPHDGRPRSYLQWAEKERARRRTHGQRRDRRGIGGLEARRRRAQQRERGADRARQRHTRGTRHPRRAGAAESVVGGQLRRRAEEPVVRAPPAAADERARADGAFRPVPPRVSPRHAAPRQPARPRPARLRAAFAQPARDWGGCSRWQTRRCWCVSARPLDT